MRVFAIETSDRVGSLAALRLSGEAISLAGQMSLPEDQRSARSLLPTIQLMLSDCDWEPNQLGLICVTTGPGSFTGLRIGVTTAKVLAYATGAKVVEVSTLSAIAAGISNPSQGLWTILDAQRQELFAAHFKPGWQAELPGFPATRIVRVESWLQELRSGDMVAGPPLRKLAEKLPSEVKAADSEQWSPSAEAVGRLGIAAYQAGQVADAMQLVPRYYRKSAAEEKAEL